MGVLLVYDITRGQTFENAINRWLNEVKTYAEKDAIVMLIGNKSDLRHLRNVSKEEATEFAKRNDLKFIETSALDATNIAEAHEILIKEIAKNLMKKELENGTVSSRKGRTIGKGDTVDLSGGLVEIESKCCLTD